MSPSDSPVERRDMLRKLLRLGGASAAAAGLGFWLSGRSHRPEAPLPINVKTDFAVPPDPKFPEMVVVHGDDPRRLVRRAMEEQIGRAHV